MPDYFSPKKLLEKIFLHMVTMRDEPGVFVNKAGLFLRKPITDVQEQPEEEGRVKFKRHLNGFHLITIGIGAIIGAGIFIITGQAAAAYAGPAVVLCFLIASCICFFAGLCYAELSSLIPVSGGSYTYAYVALGEFPAWIVGWSIFIQLLVTASTVAIGWAGYFTSFIKDFGLIIPASLAREPFAYDSKLGFYFTESFLNLPAIVFVGLLTMLISIGIRAAAYFNNAMVAIKLSAIILFIIIGIPYIQSSNWTPFIPENTGVFGQFGWSGIFRGAGLVFFAYIGFDTISSLSQETVHPQRNVPIGTLGSLGICTLLYILTALVLTGIASYTLLSVPDPMSIALNIIGMKLYWLSFIIKLAILAGLASVVLVMILGLTRIVYAIGKDQLIPKAFANVHAKTKTPLFSTYLVGLSIALVSAFFPMEMLGQLAAMTTLFILSIVCLGVLFLRYRHPELKRPFKTPLVPYIPLLGIGGCVLQMLFMPSFTWVQLVSWHVIGIILYFSYGKRKSRLQKMARGHHLSDTLY